MQRRAVSATVPLAAFVLASFAVAPAASADAPSPSPSSPPVAPSSAPTADPAVTARAMDWFHALQTGKLDRSQLTTEANAAFTDTLVAQVAAQIGPFGTPSSFAFLGKNTVGGVTAYVYKLGFTSPTPALTFVFATDAANKIAGLRVIPSSA
ncbi:MAG: hypothetical protein IAI48_12925 [Candidatus Eremiobacteraeota bacterium]|nr:hypothetical protein [Candidatus Eremiobacteraeota bacterium]